VYAAPLARKRKLAQASNEKFYLGMVVGGLLIGNIIQHSPLINFTHWLIQLAHFNLYDLLLTCSCHDDK
jgi:hypothetical protein